MRRVHIVATCLLGVLIIDGGWTMANAQTPTSLSSVAMASRIGSLRVDRALLDSSAERRLGVLDQGHGRLSFAPHRHWSWLFPHDRTWSGTPWRALNDGNSASGTSVVRTVKPL
ncbi:MAG TPA: hypothetical protein VI485_03175 [Vicinamibacterales bacterium]|nr:hypothetical protein [Vicinamibacterales bacterium]